jgi:hypothetical protein
VSLPFVRSFEIPERRSPQAEVAPTDQGRLSDLRFRAFAECATGAVLDPACATLLLPGSMLGKINVITFRFSPYGGGLHKNHLSSRLALGQRDKRDWARVS